MIHVDALLAEVAPNLPCGPNLEYDSAFIAVEAILRGKLERQVGNTVVPAEEPNWAEVHNRAVGLLSRTKDLRVAIILTRALMHTDGLSGLHLGLELIQGLLERYWDHVHPQLEDGNDPIMRVNALASLVDQETLLRDVRNIVIIRSRSQGQFSVRDVEIALGRLPNHGVGLRPTLSRIESAIQDETQRTLTQADLRAMLRTVGTISRLVRERVGAELAPDLGRLRELIESLLSVYVAGEFDPFGAAAPAPTESAAPASLHPHEEAVPGTAEPVRLGASAPPRVTVGEEFTARLLAYVPEIEEDVLRQLGRISPGSTAYLGARTCRWKGGTEVSVMLSASGLEVSPAEQTFTWEGDRSIVDFDLVVPNDCALTATVLKFDVAISGIVVARLRLGVEIGPFEARQERIMHDVAAARTAFASYSSKDRDRVLDRIAAVRIAAGLDVFLDCLSLNPGEEWKPILEAEISLRDIFLLFWSQAAADSEWVKWEWETAIEKKGDRGAAIQIHPLEVGISLPSKLSHLHGGDVLMHLRSSAGQADSPVKH